MTTGRKAVGSIANNSRPCARPTSQGAYLWRFTYLIIRTSCQLVEEGSIKSWKLVEPRPNTLTATAPFLEHILQNRVVESRDIHLTSLTLPVDIYDFDLSNSPQPSINTLHAAGKSVMCYFSAGTYELNRPNTATILSDSSTVNATFEWLPEEK